MNQETEKHKRPRWFKIICIAYISLAILFFIVFLVTAITKGDKPIEAESMAGTVIKWSGILLLWFTIIGIPCLGLLGWGLDSKNKILKYILFLLSAGWLILWVINIILQTHYC